MGSEEHKQALKTFKFYVCLLISLVLKTYSGKNLMIFSLISKTTKLLKLKQRKFFIIKRVLLNKQILHYHNDAPA